MEPQPLVLQLGSPPHCGEGPGVGAASANESVPRACRPGYDTLAPRGGAGFITVSAFKTPLFA